MTTHTYVKTDTGECHIFINGVHHGRAIDEATARDICRAGNKRPSNWAALLILLLAGGATLIVLSESRSPQLSDTQVEALDNYRQLDAKIIKACRAEGLDKRACDAYRAEVRKAVAR